MQEGLSSHEGRVGGDRKSTVRVQARRNEARRRSGERQENSASLRSPRLSAPSVEMTWHRGRFLGTQEMFTLCATSVEHS